MVFAPRRFGKSSLVWRPCEQPRDGRGARRPRRSDDHARKERLAAALARPIYEQSLATGSSWEQATGPLLSLAACSRRSVSTRDRGRRFSASPRPSEPADIDATLERLLELAGRAGRGARRRRVALVIDEFQEIVDDRPRLAQALAVRLPATAGVSHVYLGSKQHVMERIFNDANEPFWRSAKSIELDLIPAAQFAAFPRPHGSRRREDRRPGRVDRLSRSTGGHPYATQELCLLPLGADARWRHRLGPRWRPPWAPCCVLNTLTSPCYGKGIGGAEAGPAGAGARTRPPIQPRLPRPPWPAGAPQRSEGADGAGTSAKSSAANAALTESYSPSSPSGCGRALES